MCGRRWMMDFFFFNDTATTEIYTLSLHDALPILKDNQNGFALTVPWAATEELNNDDFYYKDTISTIEIKYTGTVTKEAAKGSEDVDANKNTATINPNDKENDKGKSVHIYTGQITDRKSTRLNSSHANISYAVFC